MTGLQVLATPLRRPQATTAVACAAAATSLVCAIGAVALHGSAGAPPQPADLVLATVYPLVAALIIAHQPRNLVGWLLISCATMGPYLLAGQYAMSTWSEPSALTYFAAWYSVWGFFPYFVLWALTPMHFPDGALPAPRWRGVRRALCGLLATLVLARMFAPVPSDVSPTIGNPLGIAGAQWLNVITLATSLLLLVLGAAVGVAAVVQRTRRAHGVERRRMWWLLVGVGWLALANVLSLVLEPLQSQSDPWFVLGLLGLVACIGVGVIRHELFEVREGLRRWIVNGVLVVLIAAAAAATLAATGTGGQPRRIALLTLAVVCLLVAAAHDQLQQVVDRAVFGHRQDPTAVLASLRRRLDLSTGPVDALGQLVGGVCEALRVPYARIDPVTPTVPVLEVGTATTEAVTFSAVDSGETVGHLVVGYRAGSRFTRRDRRVLDAVAERAGTLLRQAELSAEVQAQREKLVAAREDERRRLRRDLHDGVGPALAGIAMQLDQLAGRLDHQPDLVERATVARDDLRRTVGSVRRMVDGLRPAALDDLGLVGALSLLADRYEGGVVLHCEELPELSAASEAAAFLVTGEAITNAMRHSGCRTCTVEVHSEPPWLVVTVTDDGRGIPESAPPGVGLRSMRDRTAEVGGRLEVTSATDGTVVRVQLPVQAGP